MSQLIIFSDIYPDSEHKFRLGWLQLLGFVYLLYVLPFLPSKCFRNLPPAFWGLFHPKPITYTFVRFFSYSTYFNYSITSMVHEVLFIFRLSRDGYGRCYTVHTLATCSNLLRDYASRLICRFFFITGKELFALS